MTTKRELNSTPERPTSKAGGTLRVVPVDGIVPDDNNRTIDETTDSFATLVDSIRVLGILNPVHVHEDGIGFRVIDGERRWRAAKKAGLGEIPVYVWPSSAARQEALIAGVVLNDQREAHSCLHVARRLHEIRIQNGLTGEQVAAQSGLPLARVKTYLGLFQGSEFLLQFFLDHEVPLHIAAELVRYEKATNEARARRLALSYAMITVGPGHALETRAPRGPILGRKCCSGIRYRRHLATEALMGERLSWTDIYARYPDEWVTMTGFEWQDGDEDNGELVSAIVLGHGTKRGESLRATRELREREQVMEVGEWFTGDLFPRTLSVP
jgi:ParB family chromosome partitioning protein